MQETFDPMDPTVSDEAFQRISASLPDEAALSRQLVEAAAGIYVELKMRDETGTKRGFKADLRALRTKIGAAADAVERMTLPITATIGVAWLVQEYPKDDRPVRRIGELGKELRWMDQAIGTALGSLTKPYVRRTPERLEIAIYILSTAFRRATGKQVTHSAHIDGDYRGGALSPFGKFVIAFFAEVDPQVSDTAMGNVIRKNLDLLREPLAE